MNDFVDPKSRKVTLPEGCKDLVDLLRRERPTDAPTFMGWPRSHRRPWPRIRDIALVELPNVVHFLFEPSQLRRSVIICTPDELELVSLGWKQEQPAVVAMLCFLERPGMVPRARKFLSGLGKEPSPPHLEHLKPDDLPLDELLNYESFATCALELDVLLRRFFNEFLGLPPNSRLTCLTSRRRLDDSDASDTAQS